MESNEESKGLRMGNTDNASAFNRDNDFEPNISHSSHKNAIKGPEMSLVNFETTVLELGKQLASQLIQWKETENAMQLSRALDHFQREAFHIVFCGEFNRGKSTLVSGLLGSVRLPCSLLPTTAFNCHVVWGDQSSVTIVFKSGKELPQSLEQLERWTLPYESHATEDVSHIEIRTCTKLLDENRVLIDTPGSQESVLRTNTAAAAIEDADFVVVVLDARQLLGEQDQKLIDYIHRELGRPIAVVINFINYFGDDSERQESLSRLRNWWKSHLDQDIDDWCFKIDCLAAVRRRLDNEEFGSDDFSNLRSCLMNLDRVQQTKIRDRVRFHRLRTTVDWVAHQQATKISHLEEHIDRLQQIQADQQEHRRRSIEQFEMQADLEKGCLIGRAEQMLRTACDTLYSAFQAESLPWLQSHANTYFVNSLTQTLSEIQQVGTSISAKLAEQSATSRGKLRFSIKDPNMNAELLKPRSISRKRSDEENVQGIIVSSIIGAVVGFLGTGFRPMGGVVGGALGGIVGSQLGDKTEEAIDSKCYALAARDSWAAKQTPILRCLATAIDNEIRRCRLNLEQSLVRSNDGDQLPQHIHELTGRSELLKQLNILKSYLEDKA